MKTNKKTKENKAVIKPLNDGADTPVADKMVTTVPAASEAALFKQANNPLGDPNKA